MTDGGIHILRGPDHVIGKRGPERPPWARGKRARCRRCDWLRPAESFWRLVLDYEPGAPHYGYYEPVVVWICEECERARR